MVIVLIAFLYRWDTIPYHTILGHRGLDLPRTLLRTIYGPMRTPCWNGKERWRVYPGVGGALLLSLLLLSLVVCKGEGGEIEGLVPIILRARSVLYVSFL